MSVAELTQASESPIRSESSGCVTGGDPVTLVRSANLHAGREVTRPSKPVSWWSKLMPAQRNAKRLSRRWLQFSLRSLLVGTVVVSVPLAFIATEVARVGRQHRAIAAIESMGGGYYFEYDFAGGPSYPPSRGFFRNVVSDEAFAYVKAVWFNDTQITDSSLAHLHGLSELGYLDLGNTQITNAGLAHLKGLVKLDSLDVGNTQITDAGLAHLKGLRLISLNLDNTQITDAGLLHLNGMTSLMALNLSNTQITDRGLMSLEGLTNMTWLWLDNTRITDAGLVHLDGMTGMWHLYLSNTRITDEGVAKLQKAFSNCSIHK